MLGIKVPWQDFVLKMLGGGAYARGGAYLRDTTILGNFSQNAVGSAPDT